MLGVINNIVYLDSYEDKVLHPYSVAAGMLFMKLNVMIVLKCCW